MMHKSWILGISKFAKVLSFRPHFPDVIHLVKAVQQRFLEEDYIIETLTLARQPNVLWLAMGDVETQDVGEYHG